MKRMLRRMATERARSPTHKLHPDSDSGELDQGDVVFGMLLVARGDGAIVFDFAEEPFDRIAQFVKRHVEGGMADPVGHGPDIGDGTALFHRCSQGIGVVSPVGEQDIARTQAVEHVSGAAPVVGLARRNLEQDRQPIGIDQCMNFGGQPASRAPHASGVNVVPSLGLRTPFLLLAPCW